ncbi:MAG: trypsin-like peptidase domain-containing protein [Rhizonema sp. PD37]|nr:trypsin-like peptidase domain-containing protein [Rhizonema sp. PD37]
MKPHLSSKTASQLVRGTMFWLLAISGAIATTTVSEFALTLADASDKVAYAQKADGSAQSVYEKANSAVVFVETDQGSGSGVVVESKGLIVTNAHVVEDARSITVELQNGKKYQADVVSQGSSQCLDLALLQIRSQNPLPKLNLTSLNAVRKGQQVFAIGYPQGIKPSSITQGIVSNIYAELGFIQTDANLNHGNSGGALLNSRGELLGINTRRFDTDSNGMNLAISSEKVQAFILAYKQRLSPSIGKYLIPATRQTNTQLAQKLALNGAESNSRIRTGDNLMCEDKTHAHIYSFEGKADEPIMIEMLSQEIGSFLVLLAPNGEMIAKGSSEGRNKVARISSNLPQTGTYTLIANALEPQETGTYRLRAAIPLLVQQDKLDRSTPSCLKDGSPCRSYVFSGKANQTITIQLQHSDFDPYLLVVDSDRNIIAKGKVERQAAVSVKLPHNGNYRLVVSTANPQDRGQFALSVYTQGENSPAHVVSHK